MTEFTMDIRGAKNVAYVLDRLSAESARRVLKPALQEGGKVLVAAIKLRAPRRTGKLAKSFTTNTLSSFGTHTAKAIVGPRIGQGGAHAHLVEFGTGPRHDASGKYMGIMPAMPFIRPAMEESWRDVMAAISSEVDAGLEREATRARVGGPR